VRATAAALLCKLLALSAVAVPSDWTLSHRHLSVHFMLLLLLLQAL
jgi:hypothetical protein